MKAAAMGVNRATSVIDPVCGMEIDPARAREAGRVVVFNGTTYYFCSDSCRTKFAKEPLRYLGAFAPGDDAGPAARVRTVARRPAATAAGSVDRPVEQPPRAAPAIDPAAAAPPLAMSPAQLAATGGQLPVAAWSPTPDAAAQYVPKNKRLRRPGSAGPGMQLMTPDEPPPALPAVPPPGPPGTGLAPPTTADAGAASSPSRLVPFGPAQAAANAQAAPTAVKDVVCGMGVDPKTADQAGLKSVYNGKTYWFCSEECKKSFDASPEKYVK
jgi:YHS domain-containing protein